MGTNNWNAEQRQRQVQAIHRWRPWESSTGPRTIEGKSAVSKNATKHNTRTQAAQDMQAAVSALLDQTLKAWGDHLNAQQLTVEVIDHIECPNTPTVG
jgi:hypothetical protein